MITQIQPFDKTVNNRVYYDLGVPKIFETETDPSALMNSLYVAHLWMDRTIDIHQVWFTEARFLRYFIKKYIKR